MPMQETEPCPKIHVVCPGSIHGSLEHWHCTQPRVGWAWTCVRSVGDMREPRTCPWGQRCTIPAFQDELADGPCSLWFLSQVIEATIERHKQNSQTFKAFSGSFGHEEDPSLAPDSPVSTSALGAREGPGGDMLQPPCGRADISEGSWSLHSPCVRDQGLGGGQSSLPALC